MLRQLLVVALAAFVANVATLGPISAQAPTAPPSDSVQRLTFDVASVRPSPSPAQLIQDAPRGPNGELRLAITPGIRTFPGGRLTANVVAVRRLIAWAYDVQDWQIEGAATWMEDEYFSIEARAPADATSAQFKEMLQTLLADRFKLEARRSTRPGKVHTLVLARSDGRLGPQLIRTSPGCVRQIEERGRVEAVARAEGRTLNPADLPTSAVSVLRFRERTLACGTV